MGARRAYSIPVARDSLKDKYQIFNFNFPTISSFFLYEHYMWLYILVFVCIYMGKERELPVQ